MKIRNGFVSNSSSSSFIIYSKKELDISVLKDLFEMPEGHPLEDIGDAVAKTFMSNADRINSWEEFVSDFYDEDEALDCGGASVKAKLDEGWFMYTGEFSNEGYDDVMEDYLCDTTLNIDTPNLIIEHEGGF